MRAQRILWLWRAILGVGVATGTCVEKQRGENTVPNSKSYITFRILARASSTFSRLLKALMRI